MKDPERSATPVADEKVVSQHKENMMGEVAAERGQLATDEYGEPLIEFDQAAESKLRLKIDLYIVPTVAVMYLFCFIDRANIGAYANSHTSTCIYPSSSTDCTSEIGNAKLAGFNKDLGLVNYDYNAVLSIFFISYIIFEIPSNIMCKWIGPGWWLPAITLGFGICSVATAFVKDIHSASGVRFLLG